MLTKHIVKHTKQKTKFLKTNSLICDEFMPSDNREKERKNNYFRYETN